MFSTKRKGNSTELNCASYLYDCGCEILFPYGDDQKYDLVIDYKNKFYKIQCKTANPSFKENGEIDYITFKTHWESGRSDRKRVKYDKDDIDFFATFFENECYIVPVEETSISGKIIRFSPPKNGQTKGINFAKDYLAKNVLEKL